MKKYLKLLTTLLVMAFLCMSCGGNGSVNSTEKESNANSEEEPLYMKCQAMGKNVI